MEDGVHQYYAGQPVVTLGLDIYNGSPAAVEIFRQVTGVTFPLLTQAGTYSSLNQGNYRKVVIDADGIVRYVSAPYVLNIPAIRSHVDEWLPLDEPTFEFEMTETEIQYFEYDVFNYYIFHGHVNNLLNSERQLDFTMTPLETPDPLRGYSICTFVTCYPPDSGVVEVTETYSPLQEDPNVSVYVQSLAINPETGFMDTATIHGNYTLRFTVSNPEDAEEVISFDLHLEDAVSVTPRIEPVINSSQLLSNYPNPFNPETTVNFVVANPGAVQLNVFNLLGQNVATLVNSPFMGIGNYSASWRAVNNNGIPLPSGNYILELNNAGARALHRVVLMK